jgi:uncharacterized membrane protein YkvA (DUF1232 family)
VVKRVNIQDLWRLKMNDELTPPTEEKKELSGFLRTITEPLSSRGWPTWLVYLMSAIGVIYLLNPTFGVLEFLPDNLPVIGNMDEGLAVMLILAGIAEMSEGKKSRRAEKENKAVAKTQTESKPEE